MAVLGKILDLLQNIQSDGAEDLPDLIEISQANELVRMSATEIEQLLSHGNEQICGLLLDQSLLDESSTFSMRVPTLRPCSLNQSSDSCESGIGPIIWKSPLG